MTPATLRAWRLANALTQRELAALLGVHWAKISYWENGVRRMDGPTRLALRLLQDPDILRLALKREHIYDAIQSS